MYAVEWRVAFQAHPPGSLHYAAQYDPAGLTLLACRSAYRDAVPLACEENTPDLQTHQRTCEQARFPP